MTDYWAAFGAYTVLFLGAGAGGDVGQLAVIFAWTMAGVALLAWIRSLSANGQKPFGTAPFWSAAQPQGSA